MTGSIPLEHVSVEPDRARDRAAGMIILHGRGADERDLLPLADQLPGDRHVLSFRAPAALGRGYTWYDLDLSEGGLHASQPDEEDFSESLEALRASVEAGVSRYGLDSDRIGLLGFSQGAILALSLLLEHPGIPEWVVGLHGYLPARYDEGDIASASGVPVFLGAGSEDEVIPERRVRDAAERLSAGGVEVTFRTYPAGHGVAQEELADVSAWLQARDGDT